jgi:hypothetical protein
VSRTEKSPSSGNCETEYSEPNKIKITPFNLHEKIFTFSEINISFSASSKIIIVLSLNFGSGRPP